jgi:hypothetical protein
MLFLSFETTEAIVLSYICPVEERAKYYFFFFLLLSTSLKLNLSLVTPMPGMREVERDCRKDSAG